MKQKLENSPKFFSSAKNTDTVPAFLYPVKIYEDMKDLVQGGGRMINEIFIPSSQAIFNSEYYMLTNPAPRNRMTNLDDDKETRAPLTEITISQGLAQTITAIIKLESQVTEEKACLKKEWCVAEQSNEILDPVTVSKYKIKIYKGMMDVAHRGGHKVDEYFIPSHNLIYNSDDAISHADASRNISVDLFSGEKTIRHKQTIIQIPKALADKVLTIADLEETINKEKKQLKSEFDQEINSLFSKKIILENDEDSSEILEEQWCSLL